MESYDENIKKLRDEIAVRDLPEGRLKVEQIKSYNRHIKSIQRKTIFNAFGAAILFGISVWLGIRYSTDGRGFNAGRGLLLGIILYSMLLIINEAVVSDKNKKETINKRNAAKAELKEIRRQNEVDKRI